MYIRACVCVCIYIYIYTCKSMYLLTYKRMYLLTHTHTHKYVPGFEIYRGLEHASHSSISPSTYMHTHTHTYTHTGTYKASRYTGNFGSRTRISQQHPSLPVPCQLPKPGSRHLPQNRESTTYPGHRYLFPGLPVHQMHRVLIPEYTPPGHRMRTLR
jgi:hypothetical protein